MANKILTCEYIAKELNVNIRTVYNYINKKQLKAVKVGKKYIIDQKDYNDFLKRGTEKNYFVK